MEENIATSIWDPFGGSINSNSYIDQRQSLISKLQKYRQNPALLKRYLYLLILIPLVVFIIFLLNYKYLLNRASFTLIIISCLPLYFYYRYIMQLQDDLILYLLCENNHWLFNPNQDVDRYQHLKMILPKVFSIGRDQKIIDQIWGNVQFEENVDFWRSTFIYTVGSGKSSHTYTKAIFVLRLNKQLPVSFTLSKAGILSKFEDVVKTESNDFNNLFQITSNQKDTASKMQIIKILSPSVQVRLLDFRQSMEIDSINFQQGYIAIVFSSEIWRPTYTNFFNKIEIDSRDESLFLETLKEMVKLPVEIIKYID